MNYILSIENDRVVLISEENRERVFIDSVEEFNSYIERAKHDVAVLKSSSIDFPEEFTSNPETIALAKALA